jgi:hypothetical protein
MENIPYELLFEILLKVRDIVDVLNMCATNSNINSICSDDYFWQRKFMLDYPKLKDVTPRGDSSYQNLYQYIYLSRIGQHLSIQPDFNSHISFIIPEPYYHILNNYYGKFKIEPDIKIFKNTTLEEFYSDPSNIGENFDKQLQRYPEGQWHQKTYIRKTDRFQVEKVFTSKSMSTEEMIGAVNKLLRRGYYVLWDPMLSRDEYDSLRKKGLTYEEDDDYDSDEYSQYQSMEDWYYR